MRGGEKVLEALLELYPDAPIFTLFADRKRLSPFLQRREIHVSFLQYVPGIAHIYRWLLPLFPLAIQSLRVKKYNIVVSSSHCVAKGVHIGSDAYHICYCHTPMRYLWDFGNEYLGSFPRFIRQVIEQYFKRLRAWDVRTAQNVHVFIANSNHIAQKIERVYERQAARVIYPPVEIPSEIDVSARGDYFLVVSALVPYKRVDLAIEAFNHLQRPLVIVGDGPMRSKLQKMVRHSEIKFEGWVDQHELWERYGRARALIFPGEEDFGIVPVEAQIFGTPVIAFGRGGVTESVRPYERWDGSFDAGDSTGLLFERQEVESLVKAVERFEQLTFDPDFIRRHAQRYRRERFQEEFQEVMQPFLPTPPKRERVTIS